MADQGGTPRAKYRRATVTMEVSMPEAWEESGGRAALIEGIERLFGMRLPVDYSGGAQPPGVGPHGACLHGMFVTTWVPGTVDGNASEENIVKARMEYRLETSPAKRDEQNAWEVKGHKLGYEQALKDMKSQQHNMTDDVCCPDCKQAIQACDESGCAGAKRAGWRSMESMESTTVEIPKVRDFNLSPLSREEHEAWDAAIHEEDALLPIRPNSYDSTKDNSPWCENKGCPVEHRQSSVCPLIKDEGSDRQVWRQEVAEPNPARPVIGGYDA